MQCLPTPISASPARPGRIAGAVTRGIAEDKEIAGSICSRSEAIEAGPGPLQPPSGSRGQSDGRVVEPRSTDFTCIDAIEWIRDGDTGHVRAGEYGALQLCASENRALEMCQLESTLVQRRSHE